MAEREWKGLPAGDLRWRCDPDRLGFETTETLEPVTGLDGARRWSEALEFGVSVRRPGYNIFAIGPQGIGKHTLSRHVIEQHAGAEPVPDDWCYVYNFSHPRKPRALRLPPGRGRTFKKDVERLVADLKQVLVATFEGEDYRTRRQLVEQELKDRQEKAFSEVESEAERDSIALLRTPLGFAFAPVRDGKVLPPQAFQALPEGERKAIEEKTEALQKKLQSILQQVPLWVRQAQEKVRDLNRETAELAVTGMFEGLQKDYQDIPPVLEQLEALKSDMISNADSILQMPDGMGQEAADEPSHTPLLRRYGVNLIVDNADLEHAPVVYEDNPTYDRLIGRLEHRAEMGALVTDFHLIRAGALHDALGGYLLVDARRLLTRPMAYEGLKQILRSGKIRIESLANLVGLLSTVSLEPEPIAQDVKIVLLGDRMLYYLLSELDPEFDELFRVVADFDSEIDRSDKALVDYCRLIAGLIQKAGLKPFDSQAIARVIEHGARMAGEAAKLSMKTETLGEILVEADYWAQQRSHKVVTDEDIDTALEKREYRVDRIRERIQEEIQKGTIAIATEGESVGQVNGLAVLEIAGFAFGRPNRITARARLGGGEVIDIEREAKLGGPLHSKGVMILSGYLGAHYAMDLPLSLSASLVFEQSYSGVDGDSASAAELLALLSAVADTPLRQSLAITGSVDQQGRIQAIGGVNQKIEGFFDVCSARGLTGQQGVAIPTTNVRHLMLREDVVAAVQAGKFRVIPIETIDQAIALFTGLEAGVADERNAFPAGSFNDRVAARLRGFAEARRKFAADAAAGRRKKRDDA